MESVNGSSRTTYRLSLCKALSATEEPCTHQTAVCRQDGATSFTPIGNFTSSLNVTEDAEKAELWVRMKGAPCADMAGHFTTTIINFKCGKTLVSVLQCINQQLSYMIPKKTKSGMSIYFWIIQIATIV